MRVCWWSPSYGDLPSSRGLVWQPSEKKTERVFASVAIVIFCTRTTPNTLGYLPCDAAVFLLIYEYIVFGSVT